MPFLGPDWLRRTLDLAADQPERPGASVRVQFVVGGGPGGEARYHWVVEDGQLRSAAAGNLDGAEMTWTATYSDAVAMFRGELDPGAAFMEGRVKVAGDMGKVLTLLPLLATDTYCELNDKLASETSFT